jgi:anti-anti-sigma regulatory factor
MQAIKLKTGKTQTLKVRADECLDWRSYNLFDEAALNCSQRSIRKMQIDLRHTRSIRRSGLTMLLQLIKQSGLPGDNIAIVNCRPEIRSQLAGCSFSNRFRLQ